MNYAQRPPNTAKRLSARLSPTALAHVGLRLDSIRMRFCARIDRPNPLEEPSNREPGYVRKNAAELIYARASATRAALDCACDERAAPSVRYHIQPSTAGNQSGLSLPFIARAVAFAKCRIRYVLRAIDVARVRTTARSFGGIDTASNVRHLTDKVGSYSQIHALPRGGPASSRSSLRDGAGPLGRCA